MVVKARIVQLFMRRNAQEEVSIKTKRINETKHKKESSTKK